MEIIEMVLVGKISTEIVSELIKHDGDAISLSGKDSSLIFAHKKEASQIDGEVVDLGLVGEVDKINTDLLEMFIDNDYIPVISPVGIAKASDGRKSVSSGDNIHFRHTGGVANVAWADGHATTERASYYKASCESLPAGNIGPSDKDTYYSPLQEGKGVGE